MSTNKYRKRRAMRTPTAGNKYQNEPIQAPLQKVDKSSSFNDLGREDARRIAGGLSKLPQETLNQEVTDMCNKLFEEIEERKQFLER